MNIQTTLQEKLGKEIAQASNEEIYDALLSMVQEMAGEKERTDSKKKLYYMRLYKPYHPCRGTGKMAGILFEEGRSTVNADH